MLLDIFIITTIFIAGFEIKFFFRKLLDANDRKVLNLLWLYHVVISLTFIAYVSQSGGDALGYWFNVKHFEAYDLNYYYSLGIGTTFMYVINYFPSKILELSFMTGSFLYAFLGYVGILLFYIIFKQKAASQVRLFGVKLFPYLFFLPNLHFWSSGIGKDSILFFCIAVFFYGMLRPRKHLVSMVLVLLLSYFIRPHITFFLLISFGLGFVLDGKLRSYQKILLLLPLFLILVFSLQNVLTYLRIEDLDFNSLNNFAEDKVLKLSRSHTDSAIDLSNYPYPLKVFTFLYRPLFFDINGVLAIFASVENLILLVLTLRLLRANPFKLFRKSDYFFKSMLIFFLLGTLSFSLILGNLGIMLRQKNMFIPALLFICLWSFSKQLKIREAVHSKTKETVL
ncbi:MAG TPA: hypothetical protein PKW08_10460 [Flavobacteriaceae bacterium]|nr:hypothetical protein [Flavobacteriaceae bacterium]MCB9213482.1 hypothetical protein [Alteromonas sp.]HPF12215.1 hypothetical protein [Flavobacteriaceae bacterium]HQU21998.1 hypothetical protein [Flavobacteriaceae bacterium]HQU65897.1 hypothetical protein [Flavobacteriaceae bacterium]